jgi:hypothetical protein
MAKTLRPQHGLSVFLYLGENRKDYVMQRTPFIPSGLVEAARYQTVLADL